MFKKYNINDLFLASVSIVYPFHEYNSKNGFVKIGHGNFEYNTILLKKDNKYIDLQDKFIPIISYKVNFIEPLSNYYMQDGNKISVSKRNAINIGKQYYNEFNKSKTKKLYIKQKNK